eukprot:scaffold26468_cov58-Phaeocystis_antarctica.AAC.3
MFLTITGTQPPARLSKSLRLVMVSPCGAKHMEDASIAFDEPRLLVRYQSYCPRVALRTSDDDSRTCCNSGARVKRAAENEVGAMR